MCSLRLAMFALDFLLDGALSNLGSGPREGEQIDPDCTASIARMERISYEEGTAWLASFRR